MAPWILVFNLLLTAPHQTTTISPVTSPLVSGPPSLFKISASPAVINPNLIADASFELPAADRVPDGWNWSARNTTARLAISSRAHSGKSAIAITNSTDFGADVYGMLWRKSPVKLFPGHEYILSAWVNSLDPGISWIGGGIGWQYRLQFPSTSGAWKRVAMHFVAVAEDSEFTIRVCTESPTSGILIDDIKLEEGTTPTPDPPVGGDKPSIGITPDVPDIEVEGDGPFQLKSILFLPAAQRISAVAHIGKSIVQTSLALPAGASRVTLFGESYGARNSHESADLVITDESGKTLRTQIGLTIYSASSALLRAAKAKAALREIRSLLIRAQRKGQDVSYPLVSYTVLRNFVGYSEEDARKGAVRRALMQFERPGADAITMSSPN